MSKITEKMPTGNKTINVTIPQDVKSVTITFDARTGEQVKENTVKPKGRKICD